MCSAMQGHDALDDCNRYVRVMLIVSTPLTTSIHGQMLGVRFTINVQNPITTYGDHPAAVVSAINVQECLRRSPLTEIIQRWLHCQHDAAPTRHRQLDPDRIIQMVFSVLIAAFQSRRCQNISSAQTASIRLQGGCPPTPAHTSRSGRTSPGGGLVPAGDGSS